MKRDSLSSYLSWVLLFLFHFCSIFFADFNDRRGGGRGFSFSGDGRLGPIGGQLAVWHRWGILVSPVSRLLNALIKGMVKFFGVFKVSGVMEFFIMNHGKSNESQIPQLLVGVFSIFFEFGLFQFTHEILAQQGKNRN